MTQEQRDYDDPPARRRVPPLWSIALVGLVAAACLVEAAGCVGLLRFLADLKLAPDN